MTEPTNELDRRAARAAEDLRDVAASRPRPALDSDRAVASTGSGSSNRIPRLLAVAAVLALVAGAAVVLWPRDDEAENIVAGPGGDIPGHVLDPTPDGFTAMAVNSEAWSSDEGEGSNVETLSIEQQPWHLYGPAGERAELGVIVAPEGFDEVRPTWGDDGENEVFDLAGRRAYRDEDDLGALATNAVVVEVGDVAVAVFGSVDTEIIDAVGATVTVSDGEPVIDSATLPEGWEAGEVVDPARLGFAYRDPSVNKVVFYMTEELDPVGPGFTMIQVVTGPGPVETPPDLGGVLPAMDQRVDEAEVDGKPAVLLASPVEDDDVGVYSIEWEPEPSFSVSVFVYGINITPEDVIGVAETVRPATAEEWEALLARADEMSGGGMSEATETAEGGTVTEASSATGYPAPHPSVPEVEPSDGSIPDVTVAGGGGERGTFWEARIEDGTLSISIPGAATGSGTAAIVDQPFPVAQTASGDEFLLAGVIEPGQNVRILVDGEAREPDWLEHFDTGHLLWVADAGSSGTVSVTLLDAGGRELAREDFVHVDG